jgi:two-component system response regulator YesN
MTILVVEDESRARRGLITMIHSISPSYEIIGDASNGRTAFEIILSKRPDVVFTDIRMPQMDGLELIKKVRSFQMNTRFVIVSAYEEFEYARQALTLGVDDYLVKPVMKEDVEKILAKLEPAKAYLGTGQTLKLVDQYPDAHPVVKKALNIIEEGYASDLSQSDVAERLGITAEYFSYIFAKSTGKSYTKFLRAYRINKAMDILSKDPDKKNDVCLMVGFRDQKYFAKCFKEVTGKPLSEYLQEIGE